MALVALANFASPVSGVLSLPLLAIGLGVDGRGQVAAGTAPLLFASIGLTFGIPETVTYFVARHPRLRRSMLRKAGLLMLAGGILTTLGIVALTPILEPHNAYIRHLIVLSALALTPSLFVVLLRADASAHGRWTRVAGEQVVLAACRVGGLGGLYFSGDLNATTATVVMSLAPVAGGLAYLRQRHGSGPALDTSAIASPVGMYSYGLRIWVGAISGIMLARLDQLVMTPLASERQLGLYAVAASVSEAGIAISNAVRDVTFATDASESSDERLQTTARVSGVISLLLAAVIAAPSPWWMPLAFGSAFAAAVPSCVVLLFGLAISAPGSVAGAALSSRGRPGLRSLSLTVASLVNVAVLFVLVPRYGALGAAITTLLSSVLASGLSLTWLRRYFGIRTRSMYGFRSSDLDQVRSAIRGRLVARRRPARVGD